MNERKSFYEQINKAERNEAASWNEAASFFSSKGSFQMSNIKKPWIPGLQGKEKRILNSLRNKKKAEKTVSIVLGEEVKQSINI